MSLLSAALRGSRGPALQAERAVEQERAHRRVSRLFTVRGCAFSACSAPGSRWSLPFDDGVPLCTPNFMESKLLYPEFTDLNSNLIPQGHPERLGIVFDLISGHSVVQAG